MDDKDDPYNKSYQPKPSLPPFSSLRARTFAPDGGFSASEPNSGYGTTISPFQQHQQLYSFNSYPQGSSHFHQQTQATDFPLQAISVGLQRDNRPSQLNSSQASSFLGSSTQGSHFQMRDQSQFLDILQQPPIPDMSLSLPFSTGQPGLLGSSQLPIGIQSLSMSGLFPSNTDHPPQIPLSQVESLLSEAEQKSISDFTTMSQTLDDHNISSLWQSSYNSVPAQSSEEFTSFRDFSSFNSKATSTSANTKDKHLPLEPSSKASETNFYNNRLFIPESNSRFITSTSSLPRYASSPINNVPQYQLSGISYPGNYFIPESENMMNSRGIPYSDFSDIQNIHGEHNFVHRIHVQNNRPSFISAAGGVAVSVPQKTNSVVTDQISNVTKGSQKGRKKKKLPEESSDIEVKTLMNRKRSKSSKKSKGLSKQESSLSLPSNNKDNNNTSPSFCLSPTFIASLSSKRAADAHLSDASYTGTYITEQDHVLQRSDSMQKAPSASHQDYEVQASSSNYIGTSASYQSIAPVSNNNQPVKVKGSQLPYPLVNNFSYPSVQSVSERSDGNHQFQFSSQPTNHIYSTNIPKWSSTKDKLTQSLKVETEEEEESLSPFQLSPGFIASLSSKRAEGHSVHNSIMTTNSAMVPSLESHSRTLHGMGGSSKHKFPRQQVKTSVSLLADYVSVSHTSSELQPSITPNSYVKHDIPSDRIHLLDMSESNASQKFSLQQFSLSQGFKYENVLRQASSPNRYVSPPAYHHGCEFQYPTPPMEDDEGKLQSPGLYISSFPGSLSNIEASDGLSQRLSPNNDDNISVLPTPPNSAGPKQSSLPDMTLSKEEQTSRILEIIAREREKSSSVPQIPLLETKKKKKRKKSKEVVNSDYGSGMTNMQVSSQVDQGMLPYYSEVPKDIEQPFHPDQKFPDMLQTKLASRSLPDHTNAFMQLATNTVFPEERVNETPVNWQFHHKDLQHQMVCPESGCHELDVKQNKPTRFLDNSDCVRTGDLCNQIKSFQRYEVENQQNADMSPKVSKQELYRAAANTGSSHDILSLNHFSLSKPHSVHEPKSFDKEHVKNDPYVFDDTEQVDLNSSLMRNIKPASKLPFTTKTKQLDTETVSQLPFTAQQSHSKPVQCSHPTFYSAVGKISSPDHIITTGKCHTSGSLPDDDSQIPWKGISQLQSGKTVIKSEMPPSPTHYHEHNLYSIQQTANQSESNLVSSTASLLIASQYNQKQQMQENYRNASDLSFSSEGTNMKKEFQNLPHMIKHHKSFRDSGSAVLKVVRKKRGRPPKDMSSTISSPMKPKVPKLKLNEKKLKVQTPNKIVYKMNGTEVKPGDLSLNQNLVDRLANNLMEVADCSCLGPDHIPSESTEGPYYTQLGAARDIPGVRKILEQRTGLSGSSIRIEKVIFTGKEGKSKEGCPIAKWIIRRSGPGEKYLCIVRKRPGHFCDTAVIIMVIVAWEGVDSCQADTLYDFLIGTLPQNGIETDRRCGLNEKKTCACQGVDLLRRGASFSFGCSWSMYYNGCKFARSQMARKFKLKNPDCEEELEDKLQKLATDVAPLYGRLAPDAFRNQVQFEGQAKDCRLGSQPGQPFSGVTAVVDFCCHSHRDCHNMNNGSTVVVNLTKHREFEKPDDEQYHVLPLYILDQTDELGSMDGQMAKVRSGSLEVLSRYMTEVRRRSTPYRPCKRNRTTPKKQGLKKNFKKSKLVKGRSFLSGSYLDEPSSPKSESGSFNEDGLLVSQSPSNDKMNTVLERGHAMNMVPGVGLGERIQESMSYTDLMSQQGLPGFGDIYTQFWDYFYTNGEFPPCEWMSKKRFSAISQTMSASLKSNTLIQPSSADQMFLHQQQQGQQHQEQRKLQQINIQIPVCQPQQKQQRQQSLPSTFTGKQGFQPPSPQSTYRSISPRQQHHSHNYSCETSIPVTLQNSSHSFSHTSSVTQCIPTPLPSSISLTSSKHHQLHSSEPQPPFSCQSDFTSNTSHLQLLETGGSNISHSGFAHEVSNVIVSACSSSQNSHICSQSTALVSHVSSGGCDENRAQPPPTYNQSISNQHNMQCGPQEALCSFKPQVPPPSYDESLAQSGHSNNIKLTNSQEDICIMRFSSNQSVDEPQFGSQAIQYSNDSNMSQRSLSTHLGESPICALGVQKTPFCSQLLDRQSSTHPNLRPPSAVSISVPVSPLSERQSSEFQRPPSAQLTPRPPSALSLERPSSAHFIPRNCQTSVQSPNEPKLSQSPYAVLKDGSHSAQTVKMPSSIIRSSPERSGPLSPSSQFMGINNLPQLVRGSQFVQREQTPPSGHSAEILPLPQVVPKSGICNINQQHCYQTMSQRTDSSAQKSSVGHVDSDSVNSYFAKRFESSMLSLDDQQANFIRERCWSRMSEPSLGAEIVRPPSCSSEPGLLSGRRKDLPFNLMASNTGKYDNETQSCIRTNSLHTNLDNSRIVKSENILQPQDAKNPEQQKNKDLSAKQDTAIMVKDSNCLTQSGIFKHNDEYYSHLSHVQEEEGGKTSLLPASLLAPITGNSHSENSLMYNSVMPLLACSSKLEKTPRLSGNLSESANYGIPKEATSYNGLFVSGPMGNVCLNGPVTGEMMKVHKSEGFIVPKLGQGPSEPPYEVIDSTVASVETDDNREAFNDPAMGGVAIALCHGAVLFEVAKRELHATTALKEPNRYQPKRISLVFYQHKNLNLSRHGFDEYERKTEERRNQAEQARLIDELESKGFLKGELSELASFPNLTKGTFGKVFNFPESQKTLFPLHFPRYLDSSHSEYITPVMFACMSIAFPNYMKEAFPNPSSLPRLMSGLMPVRMHSSLSDRRKDLKPAQSELNNRDTGFLVDSFEKCAGTFQKKICPWNPNIPEGNTVATNSVITRWIHDDVSVTGPYNRWVELALQVAIKKEEMNVEMESEADLKEKMFDSLSQLDHEGYVSSSHLSSDGFQYTEPNLMVEHKDLDKSASFTTNVVKFEPSHPASDVDHSTISGRPYKKVVKLKQSSDDRVGRSEVAVDGSNKCSSSEVPVANQKLESADYNYTYQGKLAGRIPQDECSNKSSLVVDDRSEAAEKAHILPVTGSDASLRSSDALPELYKNQLLNALPDYSQISAGKKTDFHLSKMLARVGEPSIDNDHLRKSSTKDVNLNHTEYEAEWSYQSVAEKNIPLHIPNSNSLLENPVNIADREKYASDMENKCENSLDSLVSKKQESVYDFLIKRLSRSFLSNQANSAQGMQDELSCNTQNGCS